MLTVFVRLTRLVETANEALVVPVRTVTVDGTDAAVESLLASATTAFPVGAVSSVTVPVDVCPPVTPAGLNASPVRTGRAGGGDDAAASILKRTPSPKAPPTTVEP